MRCIHMTETKNLKSIKNKGLLPNTPYLKNHISHFKPFFKKEEVIYSMLFTTKKQTEKYIKDFVYFQLWGKPRNIYMDEKNDGTAFREAYNKFFKIEFSEFSILSFQINTRKEKHLKVIHQQSPDTCYNLKDMDLRFSHEDKPLVILSKKIKSERLSIIGESFPIIRNNKIENVKLNWA